ncbi:MAG TPA: hypothetical protein EYG18_06530 [Micavibrio sp.]|jgi:hypothetical protein|nr:hypothetical protein [Micavibrio sp.]HIL28906.1 hypothetical protein [Micavibrio sp.]|tara:strand:- start:103 stop:324 length:222 start_codon:yes stop_codon:yes gene_type:complete
MSGKYVRLQAPEDTAAGDFASAISSKFAAADKKGRGAVFASVSSDKSCEGVVCARVKGTPTAAQLQTIAPYKM